MSTHVAAGDAGGLRGDCLLRDGAGEPLRPGGLELTEALLDRAAFPLGSLVVDVGCGQGAGVIAMARRGLCAVGVDRAEDVVARARAAHRDTVFVLGEAGRLPFASRSVDGLLAECSLSGLSNRRCALAEWHRVLRPGGRLAISDVYRRADVAFDAVDRSPFAGWHSVADDLAAVGFRVEWFEDRSDVLRDLDEDRLASAQTVGPSHGALCGMAAAARVARPGFFLALADRPDVAPVSP